MRKNILALIIVFLFSAFFSTSSYAKEEGIRNEIREAVRNTIEEGKEASLSPKQIREEVRQEVREEIKEKNQGLMDKVKNMIKKNLRFGARIKGAISSISDSSMVVNSNDGKTYTVNITSETKLLRRFGGESQISEFSVGNEVNVTGKFTDESQTVIDAKTIRNISIQKRWGVFFGQVTTKNTDNFVMKTIERGDQTVYIGNANFINLKKETISYSDVQVGSRVRVKGIWDRSLSSITEVGEVRVFPLPQTVTPTE